MLKFFTKKAINPKAPFYFFETFSNIFFVAIGGIFTHIFLIFFAFAVINPKPIYVQTSLFSLIGAIIFIISRFKFVSKYSRILRNLNYENFLSSRKQLFFGILGTFNFYFLFCGFCLTVLGTSNGFNITIGSNNTELAGSAEKLLGFVLFMTHLFLLFLFKLVIYFGSNLVAFAHKEFEKRRKNLEVVRNKVGLGGK